ncbi:VOC family protein [Streptomyces sp. HNM0574]|uniref:VOC family protein n=1 Tax=Streptomyces sp. HNM0574 TaxID=2714954 RepID=UPI00146CEBCC|nr:VOC family protein [Streptomyces sp. HNM0574]NLU65748.1 VOC family protein [Streptomyces sp. HNM0574]
MTEAAATRHRPARHTPGKPCWASLLVHGLADCQDFYRELFGWEFRPGPQQMGPYVRALAEGHEVAGLGQMKPGVHHRAAWLPYLASDDADATAARIHECGGTVAVGPLDAEEEGRIAIVSDPVGAAFGVWQGGAHIGLKPSAAGAPGTPVWYELVTVETSFAGKFYGSVFGHHAEAVVSGEFDYLTLHVGGEPVAGVHGVGEELPRDKGPHWKTYFSVADTDAAARTAQRIGGRVVEPPRDSPYGRLATLADREGAEFCVIHSGGSGAD